MGGLVLCKSDLEHAGKGSCLRSEVWLLSDLTWYCVLQEGSGVSALGALGGPQLKL